MTSPPRPRPRPAASLFAALATLVVILGGCQTPEPAPDTDGVADAGPGPGTQAGVPDPDDIDPARLDPLEGLPPCPAPPDAVDSDTGDLPLPTAAVVTGADLDGGLHSVQGFTPRTPVEVMVDYLRRDGWEVLTAEDEVFESELLLERDGLRVFVKAQANCSRGSAFVMFGSRDPALVPIPQGAEA